MHAAATKNGPLAAGQNPLIFQGLHSGQVSGNAPPITFAGLFQSEDARHTRLRNVPAAPRGPDWRPVPCTR